MVTAGALLGIAFSYPLFGRLMDNVGWPHAFVYSGAVLFAYAIVWHLLASPLLPAPQASATYDAAENSGAAWQLIGNINLWLITLSYAAFGYFQYLFFYWMGYYFKSVLKIPDLQSREAQFYIMLAMGAGMALGGLSTDAVCNKLGRTVGRRFIVMTGMGLSATFGLLAVNVSDFWTITALLAVSMSALGICEGVFWTTATDIGGKYRGSSGAFMNCGGNVGGLISPLLTPIIADSIGWRGAITLACIISGIGGLVWFLITPPEAEDVMVSGRIVPSPERN